MEGFLNTHDLPMVNQDKLDLYNINDPIICSDTQGKKVPSKKISGKDGVNVEFQHFSKKELTSSPQNIL